MIRLAKKFLQENKAGYRCRTSCSSFLPAGQSALKKIIVKKFGEYTSDTLPLYRNEEIIK
jgi:hypothetical protein